jgi:hypothetical protein
MYSLEVLRVIYFPIRSDPIRSDPILCWCCVGCLDDRLFRFLEGLAPEVLKAP